MRLHSRDQRARSDLLAVVPLLRAALTRWCPVAMSAAAAKLFFFTVLYGASIADSDFCNLQNLVTALHAAL